MYNIIRKDWMTKWFVPVLFLPFFSMMAMLDKESDMKGMIIFGLAWTVVFPMFVWGTDGETKVRSLMCSLPITRETFVRGSFLSGWTFTLSGLLTLLLIVQFEGWFIPGLSIQIQEIFRLKVFLCLLWVPTITNLFFFSLYSRFDSKVAFITCLIIFLSPTVPFFVQSHMFPDSLAGGTDPIAIDMFDRAQNFVFDPQASSTELLISFVLLLLVNFGTLKLSEFLFRRNNIVT